MVIAEFIALIAAAVPAHPVAGAKPDVSTYEAIVVTQDKPVAKDLAKPAVFIRDGSAKAIVGESGTGWIV